MKFRIILTIAAALLPLAAAFADTANRITIPDDPHFDLAAGIKYQDSQEYRKEVADLCDRVRSECTPHIGEPQVAIVFDIDETLLDNREEFKRKAADTGRAGESWWNTAWWDKWVQQARAPAIPETKELALWAKKNKFVLFLITGRNSLQQLPTEHNLQQEGIPYAEVFTKPVGFRGRAEDYKTDCRRLIETRGFTIVCSVGDQESDLYGLHSLYCEKMPNKMYFIP